MIRQTIDYGRASGPLEPDHPDCCTYGHAERSPDPACPACRATILELESDFAREREEEV